LADRAQRWDEGVFFNFAKRPEDYNCIFFEIALSLAAHDRQRQALPKASIDPRESFDRLRIWLRSEVFEEALGLFRTLCVRAHHRQNEENDDWKQGPPPWSAVITRQWFTALRYWLGRAPAESREVKIVPLPSGISISGEWYLGVWAHSAVPEIGLKIIDSLISEVAQSERLAIGIGLPIDNHLLDGDTSRFFPGHSWAEGFNVKELVQQAYRRSHIFRYDLLQQPLSQHLRNFLDAPPQENLVRSTRDLLVATVDGILAPTLARP
jgi:hypothetical protein